MGKVKLKKKDLLLRIELLENRIKALETCGVYSWLWNPNTIYKDTEHTIYKVTEAQFPCKWCGKLDCTDTHVTCTNIERCSIGEKNE